MKKFMFLLLMLTNSAFAQLKNGDQVPNLKFDLLNAPVAQTSLNQLKGKVVLIEFWATWCGSCMVAMPHLKKLQAKYPDQLRVISVSSETPKRIRQFLKVRPSEIWFASGYITNYIEHISPSTYSPYHSDLAWRKTGCQYKSGISYRSSYQILAGKATDNT